GRVIRMQEEEYALLVTMHHIVSDGWSMGVWLKEVSRLYEAGVRGEEEDLPELKVQYADYAIWQRRWIEEEVLEQQASYWKRTLEGAPEVLELPTDHARPAQQEFRGGRVPVTMDEEMTEKLKQLSRRHGTTLHLTLL